MEKRMEKFLWYCSIDPADTVTSQTIKIHGKIFTCNFKHCIPLELQILLSSLQVFYETFNSDNPCI